MPLTVTEQLSIINGDVAPPQSNVKNLVSQSCLVEAISFRDALKDTTGDDLATSYLTKMESVIGNLYNASLGTVEKLVRILVAIYAPDGDIAQVTSATQTGWENFIATNALQALEELARVTTTEKTAYDSLP